MTRIDNKTDSQLAYIIKDCRDAVRAMPENIKAIEYLTLANKAEQELNRRRKLRSWQEDLRRPIDRLNVPIRSRLSVNHNWYKYELNTWRQAAINIGLMKIYA